MSTPTPKQHKAFVLETYKGKLIFLEVLDEGYVDINWWPANKERQYLCSLNYDETKKLIDRLQGYVDDFETIQKGSN